MSRGFLLGFIALGGALAVLFAVFPLWDLEVAQIFFDPERARFPLSVTYEWNLVRQAANWVPFMNIAYYNYVEDVDSQLRLQEANDPA